jgi:hypothetical protein
MSQIFDEYADELREYLGDGAIRYPVTGPFDPLEPVFDAEAAAQAAVCRIPDEYPADLREALFRRVAVNLARRAIPTGILGIAEGGAPARLGSQDPEVRRMESPHRKLVVG